MPGAYRITVYNKDGSEELLASTWGDFGIVVQSDRLLWNGASEASYAYVLFSNTNVIGYATAANATVAEYPIGAEYVPSFGTTLTLYEVERDPYNITFSKTQLIVKCKDKTMQKDLQISFNGSGGGNTLKNLLDAKKSARYLFYDYNGTSVDDLIQYNDTENVTNMSYMFYYCRVLENAPQLNTSKVTDMSYMFYSCSSLTTIPQYDTSKVTSMYEMFNRCSHLTTIPLLNTINVTNTSGMFRDCHNLTTIPLLNTSKVTNMSNMFNGCGSLTNIPQIDTSNVTNMSWMVSSCSNLKSILMTNIGTNLDISASTQFERADLVTILNNLKTVTSSKTLTMGSTNLAKLTDEDKAIATNKG